MVGQRGSSDEKWFEDWKSTSRKTQRKANQSTKRMGKRWTIFSLFDKMDGGVSSFREPLGEGNLFSLGTRIGRSIYQICSWKRNVLEDVYRPRPTPYSIDGAARSAGWTYHLQDHRSLF